MSCPRHTVGPTQVTAGAGHPGAVTRPCTAPALLGEGLPSARGSAPPRMAPNSLYQLGHLSALCPREQNEGPCCELVCGDSLGGSDSSDTQVPSAGGGQSWGEVVFKHPLKCLGDQSQCRSLSEDGAAQSTGAQGCSSPGNRRLKLSPGLPPWLLALEQRAIHGDTPSRRGRSVAVAVAGAGLGGRLGAQEPRGCPGNPTPRVIGIRCSLTCRIHREAGSIYLSEPAALSACGRRWRWRGWAPRA